MPIAFFDSGLGGLNTLKVALAKMPGRNFIYFGDTANVPYGPKSPAEVRGHMVEAVEYLKDYGLTALVIACNTATCAAAPFLREQYPFPIIGMEPAIKPALELAGEGRRVLLLATALTLRSERVARLREKFDRHRQIDTLPCPELVEYAERLDFDQAAVAEILRRKLAGHDLSRYACVVLGSTHYNYFQEAIGSIFPAGLRIVDGNEGTVNHLAEMIGAGPGNPETRPEVLIHLSDDSDQPKMTAVKKMIAEVSEAPVRFI